MKNRKAVLCLLLAALLLLLCGCGSYTPRLITGITNMARLQSFRTETELRADVTLSLLDQTLPVTLGISAAGSHQTEPALGALDVRIPLRDSERHLYVYSAKQDGAEVVWAVWDDGTLWRKATLQPAGSDPAGQDSPDGLDLFRLAFALAGFFEEASPETLTDADGESREVIAYEGTIPAELLRELLPVPEADAAQETGFSLRELLPRIGDLPVKLALDRDSSLLTRVELDLTPVLGEALREAIADLLAQSGLPESAASMEIREIRSVTELSCFDQLRVELPPIPGD